jgi:RNA polymerase sigma-70 factor (ECF subfamily)
MGSPAEVRTAAAVAAVFSGRARGAAAAAIDDTVGLVWIVADRPKVAWAFTISGDRVEHIEMMATPATLDDLDLRLLDD